MTDRQQNPEELGPDPLARYIDPPSENQIAPTWDDWIGDNGPTEEVRSVVYAGIILGMMLEPSAYTQEDYLFITAGLLKDPEAGKWRRENPDATKILMPDLSEYDPGESVQWNELLNYDMLLAYMTENEPGEPDGGAHELSGVYLMEAGKMLDTAENEVWGDIAIMAAASWAAAPSAAAIAGTRAATTAAVPVAAATRAARVGTVGLREQFNQLVWYGTQQGGARLSGLLRGITMSKINLNPQQVAMKLERLLEMPRTLPRAIGKLSLGPAVFGTAMTLQGMHEGYTNPERMLEADRIADAIANPQHLPQNRPPLAPYPQATPAMNTPLYTRMQYEGVQAMGAPATAVGPDGMPAPTAGGGSRAPGAQPTSTSYPSLAGMAGEASPADAAFGPNPRGLAYGDNPLAGFAGDPMGAAQGVNKGASPFESYTGLPFQDQPRNYTPQYWASDAADTVYGMTMGQRKAFEAQAIMAGFFEDSTLPITTAGLVEVMARAQQEANTSAYVEDWNMVMDRWGIQREEESTARAPFIRDAYVRMDPETARQTVKDAMRAKLGRDPNESDMKMLGGVITSGHRAQFDAIQDANYQMWLMQGRVAEEGLTAEEAGVLTPPEVQGVDYGARFAAALDKRFEGELDRKKRTEYVEGATQNLMTGLNRAAGMMRR